MSRADFLKQAGFEISDSSAEALAARMHPKTLVKGEYLFYKGDLSDALHTVESGSLESVATSYEGRDLVFKSIGPGETIGELTVIDGAPRTASVRAVTATTLLSIGRGDLLDLARKDPEIGLSLALQCCLRMRRLSNWAEDASFAAISTRVASLLIELAGPMGEDPVRLKLTQQGIADRLGVTRESVNKVLRGLEDDAVVVLGRGWVEVLSADALQARAMS